MNFKGRDIISINDFSKEEILYVLKIAKEFDGNHRSLILQGKVLAAMFFEPSTRTRLSFTAAMEQLGGSTIGFETADVTSIQKGESLWDTIKMVEQYADVIAMRNPIEGSARLAAEAASIPVINAGDGSNQHPTQTFVDLFTILKTKGRLDNLTIGMVGDLKYGRTVHSLTIALSHFNTTFYFIAPDELKMPAEYTEYLSAKGIKFTETSSLGKASKSLDVLYATRIQKERFPDPLEYEKYKDVYMLDESLLKNVKKDLKIMHPLPRVGEISPALDNTPHAIYFQQAGNGIPVRKALLSLVLGSVK